jgi:glycosyltransferase 2 family protein
VSPVSSSSTARSPITAIRFCVSLVFVSLSLIPLVGGGGDSSRFKTVFQPLLDGLPQNVLNVTVGALQLITFAGTFGGLLALVVTKRFSQLWRIVLAGTITVVALVGLHAVVGQDILFLGKPGPGAYGPGAAFPTTEGLAALCAAILVVSPWWAVRWRRVARFVLLCAVAARIGSALADPATILTGLLIGAASSALTNLLLGVPNNRPNVESVSRVLNEFGYELLGVHPIAEPDFRGLATFAADLRSGGRLFVKVQGREYDAALLPQRIYRTLRFRELGDNRPFVSVRHRVEHEALCALKAHDDGVPTLRLRVVSQFPNDAMLIAFDSPGLRSINELGPEERTPELLNNAWKMVAALRKSHIVHHRLSGEYVRVDEHLKVFVVDFSAAELGASPRAMAGDAAEVLAVTASAIGVETAVQAAVDAIGLEAVASTLPRLQPLALSKSTRAAVKQAHCLDALKEEIQRVTGAPPIAPADLQRIKPRTLITITMAALGLWALLPQILGAGDVWAQTRTANWSWAGAAVAMSLFTYLGAAIALDGSLPDHLPFAPNLGVQFATSFVGVAAPGGSLALTARFLQRRGVDPAQSVAAVGVDTVAGVVVHFLLMGAFVAWAGTSGLSSFELPSPDVFLIAAGCIGGLVILAVLIPKVRATIFAHVVPGIRRGALGIAQTARHPTNLLSLFGGSAAVTLGYILALQASVAAFGVGPSFTSVALVYLVGSLVFAAAPTPGGIGAVEATLAAGLSSAGMRTDTAIGAVLLFRVATFWLPLIPGWFAFTALQRTGNV